MKHEHIIKSVEEGSIAWEMGIEPGDRLLQINGSIIEDVFDYHYYTNDEELLILIQKENGEEWELEIEKDYDEDLGIEFEQGLMDEYRSCRNGTHPSDPVQTRFPDLHHNLFQSQAPIPLHFPSGSE